MAYQVLHCTTLLTNKFLIKSIELRQSDNDIRLPAELKVYVLGWDLPS